MAGVTYVEGVTGVAGVRSVTTLAAALVMLAALFLSACPVNIPQDVARLQILCVVPSEISNAGAKGAAEKAIGPQCGCKIGSYRLTFTSGGGETITKTMSRGSEEVRLKVGKWDLVAEGLATDGSVLLEKQMQVSAEAGKTINIPIALHLAKGTGGLDMVLAPSQPPSPDWKYSLILTYKSLPGDTSFTGPEPISYEIPASEEKLSATELPSGFYTVAARLLDASSMVVAGATATAIIAPRQVSSGTCVIALSDPFMGISIFPPLLELSMNVAIGVDRFVAQNTQLVVPLAVPASGAEIASEWYANGGIIDASAADTGELLQGYKLSVSNFDSMESLSTVRVDALLSDPSTNLAQSISSTNFIAPGPSSSAAEWMQSIDYHAAMAPSLVNSLDPSDVGSGVASTVKWVAANPSGLIAVVGLDKPSAVHLFYSPAGREVHQENGAIVTIPSSAGWLRLWRDKVVVDKSERSPDRACISTDGSRIAVTGSTSNWLRLYTLDGAGAILSKSDIIGAKNGCPNFANIKALKFSADSRLLYVLVNVPEKIMVLNVDKLARNEYCIESEFPFSNCFDSQSLPSTSLGMEDFALLQDGWIAACSSNVARLYFIRYSEEDAEFSSPSALSSGQNGESLGDPKSIIYDGIRGICYVLGYSKKLHIVTLVDPISGYTLSSTIGLSLDFEKAKSLALARNLSGCAYLIAAGGSSLGIMTLDSGGTPTTQVALASLGEYSAIGLENNICAFGDAFITSGGDSGFVASFRIR